MDYEESSEPKRGGRSGGCSAGCAVFFVLIAIIWPLLHVFGGSYEPDILFFPMLLGGPAFLITHVLAIIALYSESTETRRLGRRALWIVWGGIAVFLLCGLAAYVIDSIRGKV